MSKYDKHKVKRQHSVLDGMLPLLEKIGKIEGIKRVIPARISYSPKRKVDYEIKIQRKTITGLKLLVHNKGGIQEVFLITNSDIDIENVRKQIENIRMDIT